MNRETGPGRRAVRVAGGLARLGLVLSLAAGCAQGADDELAPRPTRTVTVTPSPTLQPPDEIPVGEASLDDEVVWAQASELHLGRETRDLAPITVERVVATPTGAYVLARGELWSVDLRRATGTGLPPVDRVGLSRDGRSLLVDLVGDRKRRVYDVRTGALRPGRAPAALTSAVQRAGPGAYAVVPSVDGPPQVTAADGTAVEVAGMPPRFTPATWPTPATVVGLGTARDGSSSVVTCALEDEPACTTLAPVSGEDAVAFAVAALPG